MARGRHYSRSFRAPVIDHFREAEMPLRYAFLAMFLIAVCAGTPAQVFVQYLPNSGVDQPTAHERISDMARSPA